MFVTNPDQLMSASFQRDDVGFVFKSLRAGQSCALIGIGSVGKSNLMLNLTRADVRTTYLKDDAAYTLTIYLDPHTLLPLDGNALREAGALWSGFELMLDRLYRTLRHVEENTRSGKRRKSSTSADTPTLTDRVGNLLHTLRHGDAVLRQSGLRHLEEALYEILSADDRWRVAFLFDELQAFGHLPDDFFVALRGLRDHYKGRVMYVTTCHTSPSEILPVRDFTGLFGEHTRYISPLDSASAKEVIERFITRYDHDYTIRDSGRVFLNGDFYHVTGGHVGLMRRGFRPAVNYLIAEDRRPLTEYLLTHDSVRAECQRILDSLTDEEQQVFYHAIVEGEILDIVIWSRLFEKHIVKTEGGRAEFQMPLLGVYCQQAAESRVRGAERK
ncbi:MAG: hypothetical protein AAF787_22230 [Chloroflexota bacterium]